MDWLQLSIELPTHDGDIERLEEILQGLGASAVSLSNATDTQLFEPKPGETPLWARSWISGLFPASTDPAHILFSVQAQLGLAEPPRCRVESLADRDWVRLCLADLKPMRFGQRADWPDTRILRDNGLQVITSQSYDSLFRMLGAGRFDLFPREVVVAWNEQAQAAREGLELEVDEHIAIHYPTAFYFFTSRARADLATAIERGLEAMIADGSYEALFQQHHGATLERARLQQRRVIELENPDLPAQTPFEREELWYRPGASQ